MSNAIYRIRLEGENDGIVDELADDLAKRLSRIDQSVKRQRDNPSAQDGGATLVLVAPFIVPLAQLLVSWLKAKHNVKLILKLPDGSSLEADNITERGMRDLAAIAKVPVDRHD